LAIAEFRSELQNLMAKRRKAKRSPPPPGGWGWPKAPAVSTPQPDSQPGTKASHAEVQGPHLDPEGDAALARREPDPEKRPRTSALLL